MLDLLADVRQTIPPIIDYEGASSLFLDPSPLDVVLLQEIQRYNALLIMIKYEPHAPVFLSCQEFPNRSKIFLG